MFLAALGLFCCARAFSSCSERGLFSSYGGFFCCRAWALGCLDFSSSMGLVETSWIRDWTCVTCHPCPLAAIFLTTEPPRKSLWLFLKSLFASLGTSSWDQGLCVSCSHFISNAKLPSDVWLVLCDLVCVC